MTNEIEYPDRVTGNTLDAYLERGWFRMGQSIFTTDFIFPDNDFYRVFWLRYRLENIFSHNKSQKLIRANKKFTTVFKPFELNQEMEDLYQVYLQSLDFRPSRTLRSYLMEHSNSPETTDNIYDSVLIEIRDQEKLIAIGIFDKGERSIAGIINFYDPAYKKYSLGKYLMVLKAQYALEKGMSFYYPGYIAADYDKFDYKLFINPDSAEIYDPVDESWLPYSPELIKKLKNNIPPPDYFLLI